MALFDLILKQLITDERHEIAAWLLHSDVLDVQPVSVELAGESLRADTVFRVQLADGRAVMLHLEYQTRSTRRPMQWRMLDYMARLAYEHQLPLRSVVLYLDQGAGRHDTGYHHHIAPDGSLALEWHYDVIHLWRMTAEELLALQQRSLLPLAGLTRFQHPAETLPKIVAAIREEPDLARQYTLLAQLVALIRDEELHTMINQQFSDVDLEELKEFPWMWRQYQRGQEAGRAEGYIFIRQTTLKAIAMRFNPPAQDYRAVEEWLTSIDNETQLQDILLATVQAVDFAAFQQALLRGAPDEDSVKNRKDQ